MKKNLKIVLFSCSVGILLAGLFFFNVKEKANAQIKPVLYAYQVGVFKNLENAKNFARKYAFSRIIYDNGYHRIFLGVTLNNKELLSTIFDNLGYTYYIKEIEMPKEVMENIRKYDEILAKTEEKNQELVLKNMLESLPNEL